VMSADICVADVIVELMVVDEVAVLVERYDNAHACVHEHRSMCVVCLILVLNDVHACRYASA
jgi:hypothetical protein